MKTLKFAALLLLLATPLIAKPSAGDKAMAATKTLLTSSPWKISGRTWTAVRHFNPDGTFWSEGNDAEHGSWKMTQDKVVLTFADRHIDTLLLPLNPRCTAGTESLGGPAVALTVNDTTALPAPTGLAKLRRQYIAALNDLLRQYTANNQPRRAKDVVRELDKVSPGLIAPDAPPVGTWLWQHGSMLVTLHADGTVTCNNVAEDKKSKVHWHWTDKAAGKFEIDWPNGWLDKATLAQDGKTFTVLNNAGEEYTVQNMPQSGQKDNGDGDHGPRPEVEDGGR